ncbi:helix-turn-helix transcriptional regulator [Streptosporangiaceae bacterium NEAU-GS5]|nr:helix-turn-helix transcriptional regulator [Streptosporangiaceae bacterium NEAU-GS5]
MNWADLDSGHCSIARAADIVGDRWTLLILRDVSRGIRRFDELSAHLGIARNILSARLGALVANGVLERMPYAEEGRRPHQEYVMTPRGAELLPVLLALIAWGDRHLSEEPPVRAVHNGCGHEVRLVPTCTAGHALTGGGEVQIVPGPGARRVDRE